ncbi:MAG: hypothetical protein WC059_00435 [Candidatus Paceibacterota bacterium]
MDYEHITQFLSKFKKFLSDDEDVKKRIATVISKHISFEIDPKIIKLHKTTISILGSPTLRNEIFIHEQGILSDIKEIVPERVFLKISR